MSSELTPGVYFQQLTKRPPATLLVRSDVAALVGYARQGPAGLPVRIEAWRQFLAVFGEPYPVGHLADAVKGFLENGGEVCYVTRITDPTAAAASTPADQPWVFQASFRLTALASPSQPDEPPHAMLQLARKHGLGPDGYRVPNPGQWGNGLRLSLWREPAGNTSTSPGVLEQGHASQVDSIAGFRTGSLVELRQDRDDLTSVVGVLRVVRVDALSRQVHWNRSLREAAEGAIGFDLERPIRLETVEYALQLVLDGRVVESFGGLGINADHARSIGRVLAEQSLYLEVVRTPAEQGAANEFDRKNWPVEVVNQPLSGGSDGLTEVRAEDYLAALAMLEEVDDIGMLAAPDLVLRAEHAASPPTFDRVTQTNCRTLEALPKGQLFGRVLTEAEEPPSAGSRTAETVLAAGVPVAGVPVAGVPVAGAQVRYAAGGKVTHTDASGAFRLENTDTGLVTLRFEKPGFETDEQLTLVQPTDSAEPVVFYLRAIRLPPAFEQRDILRVQHAMAAQGQAGLWRVALLDPPEVDMNVEQIRAWRQNLGDLSHAALYYPWLAVPQATTASLPAGSTPRWVPPSGHIAGLIARAELTEGVHRAPANHPLRHAVRVSREIGDAVHGPLNADGINCIRGFPGRGLRPFGARTLSADAEWRYLNVRRLVSALEKTLVRTLQWTVFEPNQIVLRQAVSYNIGTLLNALWRSGALAGNKPEEAYRVKCDEDNNPPRLRDAGQLVAEVAVAPSIPFEFIVFRIGKTLDLMGVTE